MGNYGDKQQQEIHYNDSTPAYIWYATRKDAAADRRVRQRGDAALRPAGLRQHHAVSRRPAMADYNGVEVELERRFSKGFAYQIFWNVGNTYLINQDTDGTQGGESMPSINVFLPGAVPSDFDERNRFLNYRRDQQYAEAPDPLELHCRNLPFGKGKKLLGNASGCGEQAGRWLADCRTR